MAKQLPKPINVLFLDIDGVINSEMHEHLHKQVIVEYEGDMVEHHDSYRPDLAECINKLCTIYDLKIVLSSTWRKVFDIDTMRMILKDQMKIDAELIDYTTKVSLDYEYFSDPHCERDPRDRGMQISAWLDEKKYKVNKYFILDDSLDAEYGHTSQFFRVDARDGFDENHLRKFIMLFGDINQPFTSEWLKTSDEHKYSIKSWSEYKNRNLICTVYELSINDEVVKYSTDIGDLKHIALNHMVRVRDEDFNVLLENYSVTDRAELVDIDPYYIIKQDGKILKYSDKNKFYEYLISYAIGFRPKDFGLGSDAVW